MQEECRERQAEEHKLKEKIANLESIIIQQQNMMETTGYFMNKWDEKLDE